MSGQWYEMNARRRPVPRPAEDVALVESLRFAVPLWILEQRDASPGDLMRAGLRCAWAVGERGDHMMFRSRGEPTSGERNSAALAFEGLARGLAAVCLLEGRADFAGLHWCVRAHSDCPNPPPTRRKPVGNGDVAQIIAKLDEFERLLCPPNAPQRCAALSPAPGRLAAAAAKPTPRDTAIPGGDRGADVL